MVEAGLEALLPELENRIPQLGEMPWILSESMRYSVLGGGKRVRPALLLGVVDMLHGPLDQALLPACALEMIHNYSLVHDDLPGMDDDKLRRGRATTHVAFGEGQAILAGDGLLSFAFECMLKNALRHPAYLDRHVLAIDEIASSAGVTGIVGGQSMDLYCETEKITEENALSYIQYNKTAQLFVAGMRAGGRLCGANDPQLEALTDYGTKFGLLFQVVDDILDVQGDTETMGKQAGRDQTRGKLTAVSRYGLEGAKAEAARLSKEAADALKVFNKRTEFFADMLANMENRVR